MNGVRMISGNSNIQACNPILVVGLPPNTIINPNNGIFKRGTKNSACISQMILLIFLYFKPHSARAESQSLPLVEHALTDSLHNGRY